jgi:hypothetical protein
MPQALGNYFTAFSFPVGSSAGFGEDETISKNRETINNPAIPAPINIQTSLAAIPTSTFH